MGFFRIALVLTFVLVSGENVAKYRAGVVEYGIQRTSSDVAQNTRDNADRYLELIKEAAANAVDILVFPESTLNNAWTATRSTIIDHAYVINISELPCNQPKSPDVLKRLSCAAREGKLYLVINVSEKLVCNAETQSELQDEKPCAEDGYYLFNSNLVFDRDGRIISRYRKTHLFGEFAFNITPQVDVQSFKTDFGVEFGHLICFDLMFSQPPISLREKGITNFILPLMWYSELPFLTAVQYQEAWAMSYNINLLAAGANSPLSGCGGSGIFSGKNGAKTAIMSGEVETKLLMSDVFVNPDDDNALQATADKIHSINGRRMTLLRDRAEYITKFIDLDKTDYGHEYEICDNKLCCTVALKTRVTDKERENYYQYALVAYSDIRTYSGLATGGIQNCGVVACRTSEVSSCGTSFGSFLTVDNHIIFEEITIKGTFKSFNASQYPTSLRQNLLPLAVDQYEYSIQQEQTGNIVALRLKNPQNDLLTFGIFGRDFSQDGQPVPVRINTWSQSTDENLTGSDKGFDKSGTSENILDYVWSKLRFVLVIIAIYILEMM